MVIKMIKIKKTVMEIIQDAMDNPNGFDGKKIAEISNKKFFESLNK